tara:strand:- start:306 stop:413 length:108 start_codon:yes stop_codon:yes gene_type:complete
MAVIFGDRDKKEKLKFRTAKTAPLPLLEKQQIDHQ